MKLTRELKTGIVSVVVITLFIWGFNYLKGLNLFNGPANTYFVEYPNVQGLNTASEVTISGVKVGKVVDIKFNPEADKLGSLIVEFSVEHDISFTKNSIAKIYSASLMGGKSLAVLPSFEGEAAVPGDYLNGEIESDIFDSFSENINPLQAKVENVIISADSLLTGFNQIFDEQRRNEIQESISNFNKTLISLNDATKSINKMVEENQDSFKATMNNAEEMTAKLTQFSDTLINANLGATIKNLEGSLTSLNGMLNHIEEGNGTVGKLLYDEAMYDNLNNAANELEELLLEMKLHPKRFVHFSLFGKKDTGYQPNTSGN